MTTTLRPKWRSFADAHSWLASHFIGMAELPVESWVSEPVPTRRLGSAAWIWFSAPWLMRPGRSEIGVPDRWWAIDARTGQLAAYAREAAVPMLREHIDSAVVNDGLVALTPNCATIDDQQGALARFAVAIERVAETFFEDRSAPISNRNQAAEALRAVTPREIMPFYHAATPDFFAWLSAS
jgi:hypothetical protein